MSANNFKDPDNRAHLAETLKGVEETLTQIVEHNPVIPGDVRDELSALAERASEAKEFFSDKEEGNATRPQ